MPLGAYSIPTSQETLLMDFNSLHTSTISCRLSGLPLMHLSSMPTLGAKLSTLHPVYTLSASDLVRLRGSVNKLTPLELGLVLSASLSLLGAYAKAPESDATCHSAGYWNECSKYKSRAYNATIKALTLLEKLEKESYAEGYDGKFKRLLKRVNTFAFIPSSLHLVLAHEFLSSLELELASCFKSFQSSYMRDAAMLSNEGFKYLEDCTEQEKDACLEALLEREFTQDGNKRMGKVKSFQANPLPTATEIAEITLITTELATVVDITSAVEVSSLIYLKQIFESKENVLVVPSNLGSFQYYTGVYKTPSLSSASSRITSTRTTELKKRLAEARAKIFKVDTEEALSINLEDL